MKNNQIEVRAFNNYFAKLISFYVTKHPIDSTGKCQGYIAELVFTEHAEGANYEAPTFSIEISEAQELMDMLWRCGLKPSEGMTSEGQLTAIQAHLADAKAQRDMLMGVVKKYMKVADE